jgi:hypothetical protein
MISNDTEYNRYAVSIQTIVIDFITYLQVDSFELVKKYDKTYFIDPDNPSRIFCHFDNHSPPFKFLSFKNGLLIGFSYGMPVFLGESKTYPYPLLLSFPNVEDKADNFRYQKMSFSSGSVSIDNSTGLVDNLINMFGNNLDLLNYTKEGTLEIIRRYFISNYNIGLKTATFNVKDKRSRLTFKAPNTYYNKIDYPHIDERLVDKVMQDAYGYCRGVAGTCLNRFEIYSQIKPSLIFNDWFKFRFARTITSIQEVWVNMSDTWIQVFPGLGVPDNTEGNTAYQPVNPHPIRINGIKIIDGNNLPENDGVIEIWWSQALKDNPGHLYRRNGDANTVKMTGTFVNFNYAKDIVKDILMFYGDLPYDASYFAIEDWERELSAEQRQIGLCLDQSQDVFNWIEKIQNGGMLGFQMVAYKDLFSARLDNPNRKETFDIKYFEILNRDEIEVEMNGENYYSYTTINYLKDYTDNESRTIVDQSLRTAVLDQYQYDKEYQNESFLIKVEDVIKKGKIVLENYTQIRPMIKGIKLDGLRENDISLFSTGFIDFSVEIPRHMRIIQKYMKKRNYMNQIRVKVIGYSRNYKEGNIIIDVVQCDKLTVLEETDEN